MRGSEWWYDWCDIVLAIPTHCLPEKLIQEQETETSHRDSSATLLHMESWIHVPMTIIVRLQSDISYIHYSVNVCVSLSVDPSCINGVRYSKVRVYSSNSVYMENCLPYFQIHPSSRVAYNSLHFEFPWWCCHLVSECGDLGKWTSALWSLQPQQK